MLQGLNKPSVKRVRKNYLPPFEDKGWTVVGDTSLIRDFVKNGYEISYDTVNDSRYMGLTYKLPLSLAGKTVSISVQDVKGIGGAIQLTWYISGVATNKGIMFKDGNKLQDIQIPSNADSIYFKIQNSIANTGSYYFKGLQLEEGKYATEFEEKFMDGAKGMYELVPKKNISPVKDVYRTFNTTSQMGNQGGSVLISNIPVKPNTTYTLSFKGTDGLAYVVMTQKMLTTNVAHNALYSEMNTGGNGRQITVSSDKTLTFTTSAIENYVAFTTGNTQAGTFPANIYVEDIQIEEGIAPTSFEPYKLVKKPISKRLVPKKNLLLPKHSTPKYLDSTVGSSNRVTTSLRSGGIVNDNYYEVAIDNQTVTDNYYVLHGGLQSGVFKLYELKPNTTYTLSAHVKTDGSGVLGFIKGILFNKQGSVISGEKQGDYVSSTSWTRSSVTFTTDDSIAGVLIRLQVPVTGKTGKVYFDGLQLEEGTLTDFSPYADVNKKSKLSSKNMLQDIENIDTSSLWTKEISSGVTVVKTGEKFQGATVYRMTFKSTTNARVYQLFSDRGIFSASIWIKFIQYDTSFLLMLREKNMGTVFGTTSINNVIYDWQQIKLENIPVTKDFIFGVYKSAVTTTKDIIVDIAMPQLEKGSKVTEYEDYKLTNKIPKSRTAPAVSYPNLSFQRNSVEVFEGVKYRRNQPRLSHGGIMIEEQLDNYIISPSDMKHLEVVGNYYDQDTWNHTNPNKNVAQTVDKYYTLSFDIKKYDSVSPLYFSSIVVGGVVNGDAWNVRLFGTSMDKFNVVDLDNGWKRMSQTFTITANTQYLQSFVKFIVDLRDTGIVCDVKNVQLVELPYDLSFSPVFRPREDVRLPKGIVDSVQGSVEFTYIPAFNQADYKKITTSRSYITSAQSSFRIWSWGEGKTHSFNVEFNSKDSNNSNVRNNIDVTVLGSDYLKKGVPVKVKFEWSPQQVAIIIDGNRYTKSVVGKFIDVTNSEVLLGSDLNNLGGKSHMNGVYKDVIFRDRNGRITYQI